VGSVVEGDDVHGLLFGTVDIILVVVVLGVHEGFSLGGSEDESLESVDFISVHNTSNSLDVDGLHFLVDQSIVPGVASLTSFDIVGHSVVQVWNHLLGSLEHNVAVFKAVEGDLSFLKSDILFLNELLLLVDVFLDFIKQQVNCLSLVVSNLVKLVHEPVNVLWWVYLHEMLLALIVEVVQFSFAFFARLHLLGV